MRRPTDGLPEQSAWAARYPFMKRLLYQRPTLGIGVMMALAISIVASLFGYYGVLVWRFFFD
jgi:hypothetical protein